jgi:hypothetical protein
MKIGLSAIGFGTLAAPALIRTVVTSAERLNFSTVWAPEHVVLLDRYNSHYPYSTGSSGEFLAPTDIAINDPFPTLTSPPPAPAGFASRPGFAWFRSIIRWCWPRPSLRLITSVADA